MWSGAERGSLRSPWGEAALVHRALFQAALIEPVVFFKLQLVMFEDIRSERLLLLYIPNLYRLSWPPEAMYVPATGLCEADVISELTFVICL